MVYFLVDTFLPQINGSCKIMQSVPTIVIFPSSSRLRNLCTVVSWRMRRRTQRNPCLGLHADAKLNFETADLARTQSSQTTEHKTVLDADHRKCSFCTHSCRLNQWKTVRPQYEFHCVCYWDQLGLKSSLLRSIHWIADHGSRDGDDTERPWHAEPELTGGIHLSILTNHTQCCANNWLLTICEHQRIIHNICFFLSMCTIC